MNPFEQSAKLPIIAACWYDYLMSTEPNVAQIMSREEYIDAFCRWQAGPILITASAGTC